MRISHRELKGLTLSLASWTLSKVNLTQRIESRREWDKFVEQVESNLTQRIESVFRKKCNALSPGCRISHRELKGRGYGQVEGWVGGGISHRELKDLMTRLHSPHTISMNLTQRIERITLQPQFLRCGVNLTQRIERSPLCQLLRHQSHTLNLTQRIESVYFSFRRSRYSI